MQLDERARTAVVKAAAEASDNGDSGIDAAIRAYLTAIGEKPVACLACEDNPKPPNIPCAVCGRATRWGVSASPQPVAVSDEMIERAAQVIAGDEWDWKEPDGREEIRAESRVIAREALEAALAADGRGE